MADFYLVNNANLKREKLLDNEIVDALKSGTHTFEKNQMLTMKDRQGRFVTAKTDEALDLLNSGFSFATDSEIDSHLDKIEHSDISSTLEAGALGTGRGLTLGLSDLILTKSGLVKPETIRKLKENNPAISFGGEMTGIGLSIAAAAPLKAGESGLRLINMLSPGGALAAKAASKIAPSLARLPVLEAAATTGIETGIFETGNIISDIAMEKEISAESAAARVGFAMIGGGLIGGGITLAEQAISKAPSALLRAKDKIAKIPNKIKRVPSNTAVTKGTVSRENIEIMTKIEEAGNSTAESFVNFAENGDTAILTSFGKKIKDYTAEGPELGARYLKEDAQFARALNNGLTAEKLRSDPFAIEVLGDKSIAKKLPKSLDAIHYANDNVRKEAGQIMETALADGIHSKLNTYSKIIKADDFMITLPKEEMEIMSQTIPAKYLDIIEESVSHLRSKTSPDEVQFLEAVDSFVHDYLLTKSNENLTKQLHIEDLLNIRQTLDLKRAKGTFGEHYKDLVLPFRTELNKDLRSQIKTIDKIVNREKDYFIKRLADFDELPPRIRIGKNNVKTIETGANEFLQANDAYASSSRLRSSINNKLAEQYDQKGLDIGSASIAKLLYNVVVNSSKVPSIVYGMGQKIVSSHLLDHLYQGINVDKRVFFSIASNAIKKVLTKGASLTIPSSIMNEVLSDKDYKKITEYVDERASQGMTAIDQFSANNFHIMKAEPQLGEYLLNMYIKGLGFISSKIPRDPSMFPSPDWTPNNTEKERFARYWDALNNPYQSIERLGYGYITDEEIETLKTVYPEIHGAISTALMGLISNDINKFKQLPYKNKMAIQKFTGVQFLKELDPNNVRALQSQFLTNEVTTAKSPTSVKRKISQPKRTGLNLTKREEDLL